MDKDYTQQQSVDGLHRAEELSLKATVPPAEIPGYIVERLLGQGAFGQVWLGTDLNTRRNVAIKFYLHPGKMNLPSLSREVSHLVNMSAGRHIVQVLTVGWDAQPPYYVMEYLENGSLEDLIRAEGALSIPHTVSMLREIAEGLSYAHGKGVLHCDLKPANVVLDHSWRPRLADFGQGRMTNEQTPSLGTLFYMAPEQADLSASPDVVWDVYALGAIAYTMLVGSPPYRTPEAIERLDSTSTLTDRLACYRDSIQNAPPPRLHYRRRGIDKALAQIIDRCLALDPQRRFSNVQQVIGAIDNRARARIRKPLYLIGIVGPVLLLILMLLFSMRSISLATQDSLQSVQTRSLESNKFAARFVAQSLETELQALFRMVEEETRRDALRELLLQMTRTNAGVLDQLAIAPREVRLMEDRQLAGNESELQEHLATVQELANNGYRRELETYIEQRLKAMIRKEGDGSAAIFNSLFVTEDRGTITGIAFSSIEEREASSPVGGNYAYRSYFNGDRQDGSPSQEPTSFAATRSTRLSTSFRSTATGTWKVGISAPVWRAEDYREDGESPRADARPLGVMVLTINLGDFELLARDEATQPTVSEDDDPHIRFAAIVDGREGIQRGTLLQHPLFKLIKLMDRDMMRTVQMPKIDARLLEKLKNSDGVFEYVDPASQFSLGQDFQGSWIATLEQVNLPKVNENTDDQRTKSDLWILMQERSSSVAAPVRELSSKLRRESLLEFGNLLLVIVIIWYFVFRMGQNSMAASLSASPNAGSGAQENPINQFAALKSTLEAER